MTTVKGVRIHSHGGPDVMSWEDIELAPPGPGEARVRHTAIALNFSDINVRRGGFYQKDPLPMPIILGNEAAGERGDADAVDGLGLAVLVRRRVDLVEDREAPAFQRALGCGRGDGGRDVSIGARGLRGGRCGGRHLRGGRCLLHGGPTDNSQNRTDRHGLAGRNPDLGDDARRGRLHFHRGLVGFDLEQVLASGDVLALLLEPDRDLAFRDGLAELRHQHVHVRLPSSRLRALTT